MLGFGGDSSSYSSQTGKSAAPGQIAYEGVGGDQNSLTQFIRSTGNFEAKAGSDATTLGKDTTSSGTDTLKSLISQYLGPLVSGSESGTANAMQPQVDQITAQFDKVRQMLSDTAPRGGGKASALAQQPYNQIGQIASLTNTARAGAVDKAAGIGTTLAQTGLSEQQMGLQAVESAGGQGLSKAGQDIQENANTMKMVASLGESIGTMLSGIDFSSLGKAAGGSPAGSMGGGGSAPSWTQQGG